MPPARPCRRVKNVKQRHGKISHYPTLWGKEKGQGKTAEPETCRQAQACPVVPPQCPQTQRNGEAGRLPTLNAEDACKGFWGAPRRGASPAPLRRAGLPFMAGGGHGHHWPKACPQKATEAPLERLEGRSTNPKLDALAPCPPRLGETWGGKAGEALPLPQRQGLQTDAGLRRPRGRTCPAVAPECLRTGRKRLPLVFPHAGDGRG